jgi:UDP-N-acetylglucosamine 2-epimerase (non-hydrolysing)
MVSIMVVAGTRPEAIKISPVMQWLKTLGADTLLVWSGQHYDYELSELFFEQLDLPKPDVNLHSGGGSHSEQMGKTMIGLEKAIAEYKPRLVVAEGDTNTVATVALTAMKTLVPFAHLEAGLRSYDRTMPEEINRIVADSVSELLLAPTELSFMNLAHEGIPLRKICLTGNTVVDVVIKHRDKAERTGTELLNKLEISPRDYLLATIHRQENTDNIHRLSNVVKALLRLSKKHKIIFPVHPRTKAKLQSLGMYDLIRKEKNLILISPQGYFEFLGLLMHCSVVLTDSGGVQEEALTLGIPTVTLRYNTERPETVLYGMNVIAGTEPESVRKLTEEQMQKSARLRNLVKARPNPFGDGNAGRKVATAMKNAVEAGIKVEASDTRHDPYIVYALIDSDQLRRIDSSAEVLAIYDQAGYSQLPVALEHIATVDGKILVRAPLKAIKALKRQGRAVCS